jgi:hypothetical protein
VPQGLAAMMRLVPQGNFDEVVREMTAAMDDVESGEITIATRTVEIDEVTVKEGEVIALHNGKLVLSSTNLEQACLGLLKKAHADHYELITLFYGSNLQKTDANRIADVVRRAYPDQEVEIQEGNQPHYHFIIAIE